MTGADGRERAAVGGPTGPVPNGSALAPEVPAPPLPALPPAPSLATSRRDLPSGARVAVLERREVPRVTMRLVVAAGGFADGERAGAALVAAHAIASTLSERASKLGSDLAVEVGSDAAVFALAVRPEDTDAGVRLLADLVRQPRAGRAEVTRSRSRLMEAAQRAAARRDEHGARFVVVRDLYDLPTARHPYGTASPTAEEIAQVGPADVQALLTARYTPAGAALVAVGDAIASDVVASAERALGRGPARPAPGRGMSEPFARTADRVTVIERANGERAHLFVGVAAPGEENLAALAAARVAQRLVTTRLGAGAGDDLETFADGPSVLRWDLRTSARRGPIDARRVRAELSDLAQTPPAEAEVDTAKRTLLGALLREVATSDGAADAIAWDLARGRGGDAIVSRYRAIAETTPGTLSVVARDLAAAPEHMVVVGGADQVGPPMTEIAEVKVVDPLSGYARLRSLPQVPR